MVRKKLFLLVGMMLTVSDCERAMANHYGQQMSNFYSAVDLPATPPNNVFEQFAASEFAPGHRKSFLGGGSFRNTGSESISATVWLAWKDAVDSATTHLSEPFNVVVPAGEVVFDARRIIIPTSPPVVGIRIRNDGPLPLTALGGLNHETIPIPEPGGLALAAAGVAAAAKRRRT